MKAAGISGPIQAPHASPDNLNSLMGICLAMREVRDILSDSKKYDALFDRLAKEREQLDEQHENLRISLRAFDEAKTASAAELKKAWTDVEAREVAAKKQAEEARSAVAEAREVEDLATRRLAEIENRENHVRDREAFVKAGEDANREKASELEKAQQNVERIRESVAKDRGDLDKRLEALNAARAALG